MTFNNETVIIARVTITYFTVVLVRLIGRFLVSFVYVVKYY